MGPSYEELLQLEEQMGVVQRGFTPEQIAVLPTVQYSADGKGKEELTHCSICLEQFAEGEELRALPCGCAFRKACIDRWLAQSTACPLCRTRFA